MRKIKFRAWNKREEAWEQEHSCYGIGLDGTIIPATPCVTPIHPFNKDNVIIQQYTGLKDKNGVEIYEGDIFKDDYWWVGRATVEFANGMFGFECGDEVERDFRPIIECEHIEVIGNIFEGVDK